MSWRIVPSPSSRSTSTVHVHHHDTKGFVLLLVRRDGAVQQLDRYVHRLPGWHSGLREGNCCFNVVQLAGQMPNLRTLRTLDKETVLKSLGKTNRMVVAEEGWPTCSIASEIVTICMEEGFDDLDAPVIRVCNETCRCPMPRAWNN